jgi:hypothetical protein
LQRHRLSTSVERHHKTGSIFRLCFWGFLNADISGLNERSEPDAITQYYGEISLVSNEEESPPQIMSPGFVTFFVVFCFSFFSLSTGKNIEYIN